MKRHFVFFTAVLYESCLSGRSLHLAETLASQGHEVTFVDMPSTRAALGSFCRLHGWLADLGTVRVVRLTPLPAYMRLRTSPLGRAWIGYTRQALQRKIFDLEQTIVIVSTPWWVPLVQELPRKILCYDYIDDIRVHTSEQYLECFLDWDATLLSLSNMVTVVSGTLQEEIVSRVNAERVFLIPNGVPQDWIEAPPLSMPRDLLTSYPHKPIVGFLGALFEWLDISLLIQTARALPDVQFVLVGPTRRGIKLDALRGLPNVRCFGPQPHSQVPRWIRAFDICLIPFKQDRIAMAADPIKLYEYSALGKPIISTVPFDGAAQGPALYIARTPQELVGAIKQAIEADTPAYQAARLAFAKRHTWEQRAREFVAATEHIMTH